MISHPVRRLVSVAICVTTLSLSGCMLRNNAPVVAVTELAGTATHAVDVGALKRTYLLHVPPARPRRRNRAVSYPLVIVLHGSGANGETVRKMSAMDTLSDVARFLVAYPNGSTGALGLGSDWNAGDCCGAPARDNVDDVAFIDALIEQVASRMPVDRNRIYLMGFSDGGRMTYRMGCAMSSKIAAIGVVSGSLTYRACAPSRPMPVIAFHGTSDEDVAYNDSSSAAIRGTVVSQAAKSPPAIKFWAANNRCTSATLKRLSPHVAETHFDGCAGEVVLYTIDDGRHAWPGGVSDGQEPTQEISASREAWKFFSRHPLRGAPLLRNGKRE